MILRFDDFELDDRLFELRRGGRVVPTTTRIFNVLAYLVQRRDAVVTRAELVENVWRGTAVTKDSPAHAVMAARAALGDDDREPRYIATVRGRGYRFIAPVTAVLDEGAAPAPARANAPSPRTPFAGRSDALATLTAALSRAAAGRGGVALLSGEAGIGKTRLVEELVAVAGSVRVLRAPCWAFEGAPDLWPFASLLRDLHDAGEPLPADVVDLAGPAPAASASASAAVRFQRIDAIARAIVASAKRSPALLVMDDAHLCDQASLELLELLGAKIPTTPMLVLVAYRPSSAQHARFEATMGALSRASSSLSIRLGPLARADVAAWVEGILGVAHPRVVDKIFEKTKGTPFLLSQVLHVLGAGDHQGSGEPSTTALIGGDRMREAITAHLASLPEGARRVLVAAAALGTTFSVAPLAATTGADNREVLTQLDAAVSARLISPISRDQYRFSYPLVRDVLYKSVSVSERTRLHARAAAALIDRAGDGSDHRALGEIAMHLVEAAPAGDVDEAVAWSRRAAGAALADGDAEAAARYAQRGLDALRFAPRPDPAARDELRAIAARSDRR